MLQLLLLVMKHGASASSCERGGRASIRRCANAQIVSLLELFVGSTVVVILIEEVEVNNYCSSRPPRSLETREIG